MNKPQLLLRLSKSILAANLVLKLIHYKKPFFFKYEHISNFFLVFKIQGIIINNYNELEIMALSNTLIYANDNFIFFPIFQVIAECQCLISISNKLANYLH